MRINHTTLKTAYFEYMLPNDRKVLSEFQYKFRH